MTSYQWSGENLEPFEIYITRGRNPSGEIQLVETIRIHSPSVQIHRGSSGNHVSFVVMGTSGGTSAKEEDKHIYILAPGITKEELMKKGKMSISLNEEDIVLICAKDEIYAIQAKCPHAGGPLELGDIEDHPGNGACIKCPWHSWQFNLKTGECTFPGNRPTHKLRIYPVKVTNGQIRVGFDQIAEKYFKTPPS